MQKRGQFSLFLIIALVILVGFSLALYTVQTQQTADIDNKVTAAAKADPSVFKQNVENCVADRALRFAELIAYRGGSFQKVTYSPNNPSISTGVSYFNTKYRYFCKQETDRNNIFRGCSNLLLTRKDMEIELNTRIKEHVLKHCINFDQFKIAGFEVETGDFGIDTKIAVDVINIRIIYPTIIKKGTSAVNIPEYFAKIDMPLGRMFDLAVFIVNEEISKGIFDKDKWMTENGVDIRIKKHRPYPDTTYKLIKELPDSKKTYEFNFALQGEKTVSKLDNKIPPTPYKVCDIKDEKNCFINTDPQLCITKGGTATMNPQHCDSSAVFGDATCDGGICKNCDSYNIPHGGTWCFYDGLVGEGADRVGTRHYQQSCQDGKIYTEECRDYREGLCTLGSSGNHALCRTNRWEDCAYQTTKGNCEDTDVRDCYWGDFLNLDHGQGTTYERLKAIKSNCFPQVPPGFRFWDPADQTQIKKVCEMAVELTTFRQPVFATIQDIRPPKSWVNSAAFYCTTMGDCGNKRNILGFRVRGHYFNSDFWYPPNTEEVDDVYGPDIITYRDGLILRNDVFNHVYGIIYNPQPDTAAAHGIVSDFHNQIRGFSLCRTKKKFGCHKCKNNAFNCKSYVPCVKKACLPRQPVPSNYLRWFTGYSACYPWFPEEYNLFTIPAGAINLGYGYYNPNTGQIHRYDGTVLRPPSLSELNFVNQITQTINQMSGGASGGGASGVGAAQLQSYGVPDSCNFCNTDGIKPCTEYKCRSLGKNCRLHFNATTGKGFCKDAQQTLVNLGPLKVTLREDKVPSGFFLIPTTFVDQDIFDIRDEIQPMQKFEIELETNRDAFCQASIIPGQKINGKFSGLGQSNLGACGGNRQCLEIIDDGTKHTVRFQLKSDEAFSARLLELLNFTTILQTTQPGVDNINLGGFEFPVDAAKSFIAHALGVPPGQATSFTNELLLLTESRRSSLFFSCIDDNGNQDVDNVGVTFSINITDKIRPEVTIQNIQTRFDAINNIHNISIQFLPIDNADNLNCVLNAKKDDVVEGSINVFVTSNEAFTDKITELDPGDYSVNVVCSDAVNEGKATQAITLA